MVVFALLGCRLGESAHGDVVFNNFGSDDGYDTSTLADITWHIIPPAGSGGDYGLGRAARFQVTEGNYALNSVTLAMSHPFWTNNLEINIRADASGSPTGTLLETVVSHPTNITSLPSLVTYKSSLAPVMTAGNWYWLVVEPAVLNLANPDDDGVYNWYWSGTLGYAGNREYNFAAEDWYPWDVRPNSLVPAFRIEGTLIPEPASVWLLLAGLGWLGFRGWKRAQLKA
jgi:hypothetical protein